MCSRPERELGVWAQLSRFARAALQADAASCCCNFAKKERVSSRLSKRPPIIACQLIHEDGSASGVLLPVEEREAVSAHPQSPLSAAYEGTNGKVRDRHLRYRRRYPCKLPNVQSYDTPFTRTPVIKSPPTYRISASNCLVHIFISLPAPSSTTRNGASLSENFTFL